MRKKLLPILALQAVLVFGAQAQSSDTTKAVPQSSIEEMSLEDLMNVPIVSASREKENVFDTPVTSYVVTRQEIEKSGSTSIPEALRLCPALFVTEVSNGSYQVDIRGLNNAPAFDYSIGSKTALVMIDNRPVFNQLQGGTFWSNLPVDINDVERIEVVAGPSAALYGPNAATGVINIITRNLEKKGDFVYTNSQFDGTTGSTMANLSIGNKVNDRFSIIVSGNMNSRKRFYEDYYDTRIKQFVPYNQLNLASPPYFTKAGLYPNPSQSVEKRAANVFLDYKISDKTKFDLDAGIHSSDPLSMIAIGVGPSLAYFTASSWYVKTRAEFAGFTAQVSNVSGKQSFMGGVPSYQYDYRTTDFYLDYTYKFKDLMSLKPAISYQNAYITDVPYKDPLQQGIFNNNAGMFNYAGSVKLELTPIKMIRFVAAIRADRFRYPAEKTYLSYEAALNIKPNENHNIRIVASRAYQGSFIFPTFVEFNAFKPNKDLNPAKIDAFELGYRLKLSSNANFDLSLFAQEGSSYYQLLAYLSPGPNPFGPPSTTLLPTNVELKTQQTGVTLSVNTVLLDKKLQFKPFITVQQTKWVNYSPYSNVQASFFPDGGLNSGNYNTIDSKATPSYYGGFFLNYTPIEKWNFNLSSYIYDKYSLYGLAEQPSAIPSFSNPTPKYATFNPSPGSEISEKVLINFKVSYQVIKNFKVYLNARNLANNRAREFYGSDQIGAMYMFGVNFEY